MTGPLCIDLFAGCFGWSAGWLELGGCVVGFDIAHESYHGPVPKNAALVLQDVRTIHGRQFKGASLILASPPCQQYSYRSMPWKRAKALPPPDNTLFNAQFRIQREACEAAGRHIPLVVENVCGAQKWVGRARWHYGSFYLWGDVPALMPITMKRLAKVGGITWTGKNGYGSPGYVAKAFNFTAEQRLREEGIKAGDRNKGRASGGHKWDTGFDKTLSGLASAPASVEARITAKSAGSGQQHARSIKNGGDWFGSGADCSLQRRQSSKGSARKAASAHIAKIPYELARWIARCYAP